MVLSIFFSHFPTGLLSPYLTSRNIYHIYKHFVRRNWAYDNNRECTENDALYEQKEMKWKSWFRFQFS